MNRFFLLAAVVILVGCAKHNDLPSPMDLNAPPTPANFTVNMPDTGNYFLDWDVVDSLVVDYYQIYTFDPFSGPEKLVQTSVSNYHMDFRPFPLLGLIWGVSVVSVDNLESRIIYSSASSF